WINPNRPYEEAAVAFARRLVDPARGGPFMRDFLELERKVATLGMLSSLAQTVLKLTSPGVPDVYQGCELWDLSLVDPDNRRPVDYRVRMQILHDFYARCERGEIASLPAELLAAWPDGRIKAFVTWRLLQLRRRRRQVFLDGGYRPLGVVGKRARNLIAFARDDVVVVVPRLVRRLLATDARDQIRLHFDDERVRLPAGAAGGYRDVLTGLVCHPRGAFLSAADLLTTLPVAVLVPLAAADATLAPPPAFDGS
ncbi:MAG: malto-oligosyltrehalose synthase, partial [Vulcanimicrobiaceae bacterium]